MMTPFEFLSYVVDRDVLETGKDLKPIVNFLEADIVPVYEAWIRRIDAGLPCSVESICEEIGLLNPPDAVHKPSEYEFLKWVKGCRSRKALSDIMTAPGAMERRRAMVEYLELTGNSAEDVLPVDLASEYNLAEHLLGDTSGIEFPAVELTKSLGNPLSGWCVVVAGKTGAGKTTLVNSIIARNSFLKDKRCLYVYSEAQVREYVASLWSAVSQKKSNELAAATIKRVSADDELDREKLFEYFTDFKVEIKGEVIFAYAGVLDPDPYTMGQQIRKLVKEHRADYFVVDTLTRMSSSPSNGYKDSNAYGKHLSTVMTDLCVSENITGFLLCQLTAVGEEKADRDKKLGVSDILGRDGVKDASQILVVISTPEMRKDGRCYVQCLKNRHGETPPDNMAVPARFGFGWIGDPWTGDLGDAAPRTGLSGNVEDFGVDGGADVNF